MADSVHEQADEPRDGLRRRLAVEVPGGDQPNFPVLYQGGVRYRWDGEETYGMLERSSMHDKITWP